jgi:mannose-6-phosphate isomerase-like protein (cupin superfamily)
MKIEGIDAHTIIGPGQFGYGKQGCKHDDTIARKHEIRSWGTYTILDDCTGYKVKKITMNIDSSISLQYHLHRAEHWIFIAGVAKAEIGDEEMIMHSNESVYIPAGIVHRCTNIGKIPLQFIEVQTGEFLEESDIVRLTTYKQFGDIL